jgi:hypothetical protein
MWHFIITCNPKKSDEKQKSKSKAISFSLSGFIKKKCDGLPSLTFVTLLHIRINAN